MVYLSLHWDDSPYSGMNVSQLGILFIERSFSLAWFDSSYSGMIVLILRLFFL